MTLAGKMAKASTISKKSQKRIEQIAAKIKQLRLDAGYTSYEDFAHDNDMSRVQYWRMEKGVNFTINSLLEILDKHKMPLAAFFKDIE